MAPESSEALKSRVRAYWQEKPCNTEQSRAPALTREYFEEIEEKRYAVEPEIFSFAQFTRFRGSRVLEVGVGAATDFLQWARAGTELYGIDLTDAAVEHARQRLAAYGLEARDVRRADCESLPFPDNFFDVVYSWGVIHHTPDTEKAFAEIARVCRPGGRIKVMVYNRHSVIVAWLWIRRALLRGKPWMSLARMIADTVESAGTKAYTRAEARRILARNGLQEVRVSAPLSNYDSMGYGPSLFSWLARRFLPADGVGWFLMIDAKKPDSRGPAAAV